MFGFSCWFAYVEFCLLSFICLVKSKPFEQEVSIPVWWVFSDLMLAIFFVSGWLLLKDCPHPTPLLLLRFNYKFHKKIYESANLKVKKLKFNCFYISPSSYRVTDSGSENCTHTKQQRDQMARLCFSKFGHFRQ